MDPIADFLTRIRNSSEAKHEKVDIPLSKIKEGIANILKTEGFIKDFRVVRGQKQGLMRVYLRYDDKGQPVITQLKRISRPGLRRYVRSDEIPNVRNGFGSAIVSTSQGVLSGKEAKEKGIGGEILCSVW
ncbi:MAG: 30S ribosomal protein S8 [Oligoflexia bacterium]|nr:30S ribosomal protein S8 [Oligoflexia bacterium]